VEDMCYESRRAVEGLYVQEGDLLEVPAKRRRSPRPATQNGAVLSASPPPPTSQFNPGTVYPVWTILGLHRCVMKNKIKQLFLRSSSGRLGVPYPGRTELLQRHGAPKGRLTRTPTRNPSSRIHRCLSRVFYSGVFFYRGFYFFFIDLSTEHYSRIIVYLPTE
jgi:hypothetical protein